MTAIRQGPRGVSGRVPTFARCPDYFLVLVALFGSLGIHALILQTLPPIPVGAPPAQATRRRIVLQDVEMDAGEHRMAAETKSAVPEMWESSARLPSLSGLMAGEAVPHWVSSEPPVAPAGIRRRLASGRRRIETLRIEEPRFSDEESLLPRKVVPSLPVPDIGAAATTLPEVPPESLADLSARAGLATSAVEGQEIHRGGRVPGYRVDTGERRAADLVESILARSSTPERSSRVETVDQDLRFRGLYYRCEDGFTYFRLVIDAKGLKRLPVLPKDVFFLVDSSQSMGARRVRLAARAIENWLGKWIFPGDRFEIGAFSDRTRRCFGAMRRADEGARLRADSFLSNLTAGGKTDILGALSEILATEARQPAIAAIFTDARATAGTVDSMKIVNAFTHRNRGRWQVFCLSPGRKVNRFLLQFLSIPNRGGTLIVGNDQDFVSAAAATGRRLARPVMKNVTYRFTLDVEAEPEHVQDLYLDSPLVIYGRVPADQEELAVRLRGISLEGTKEAVFAIRLSGGEKGGASIRREWARRRMFSLVAEYILSGRAAPLEEAGKISQDCGIPMPYSETFVPLW